jgi:hypothetical protein
MIGRPAELREQLFARTIMVRTLVPLPDPDRIFRGVPAIESWQQDGAGGYLIAVSDSTVAAPRSRGRSSRRVPMCSRSANRSTPCRMSTSN